LFGPCEFGPKVLHNICLKAGIASTLTHLLISHVILRGSENGKRLLIAY